jgi:transketolase
MRNSFSNTITKLAKINKKIILLSGDIGNKLFDNFKKNFPEKFINCGVAESNMTTFASGLASQGYIPFTYTIASFNVLKTIEQIKIDVCYQNLPVVIVGVGSGLCYSNLGTTHHSFEDYGLLNNIPDLQIVCPCDPKELEILLPQIIKSKKPTYLKIGKKNEVNITEYDYKTKLGKLKRVRKGNKICIFSYGNIINNIINSKKYLKKKISPEIINVSTLYPLNKKQIVRCLKKFKKIMIIEEHLENTGLTNQIIAISISYNLRNTFSSISIKKKFIIGAGNILQVRKKIGMDEKSIAKKITKFYNT